MGNSEFNFAHTEFRVSKNEMDDTTLGSVELMT